MSELAAVCTVELFGPARLAAGVKEIEVPLTEPTRLHRLLPRLAERCPSLVGTILRPDAAGLAEGYQLNLNGRDFLGRRDATIQPGDRLLVIVSSAGG